MVCDHTDELVSVFLNEDYRVANTIQTGLKGAEYVESFLFGKNEPSLQHFQQMIGRFTKHHLSHLTNDE